MQLSCLMPNLSLSPEGGDRAIFLPFHTLLTLDPLPLLCVWLEINESHLHGLLVTTLGFAVWGARGWEAVQQEPEVCQWTSLRVSTAVEGFSDWQSQRFNAANKRTLADVTRFIFSAAFKREKQVSDSGEKGRTSGDGWRRWQRGHDLVSSWGSASTGCCKPLSF